MGKPLCFLLWLSVAVIFVSAHYDNHASCDCAANCRTGLSDCRTTCPCIGGKARRLQQDVDDDATDDGADVSDDIRDVDDDGVDESGRAHLDSQDDDLDDDGRDHGVPDDDDGRDDDDRDDSAPDDDDGRDDDDDDIDLSCVCPTVYDPVCTFDQNKQGNECVANCMGEEVACYGRCPCSQESCICPENIDPVCGVDDTTYNNECIADCVGMPIACNGQCPCECEDNTHTCDDPCERETCEAFPDAQCYRNYCGECSAVFVYRGLVVECDLPDDPEPSACISRGESCNSYDTIHASRFPDTLACCGDLVCCPNCVDNDDDGDDDDVPVYGTCRASCPAC